jgi:hypothetical protein
MAVQLPSRVYKKVKIDARAADIVEWVHDHPQPKYKSAVQCEKCYLGGMAFVLASINSTTPEEEYQRLLSLAKPKRRVVRKTTKKRVVRRKK